MENVGCVIFDLDGTLVDSEPICNRALVELLPDLGVNINELVVRYRGQKLARILSDVEQRLRRSLPTNFEIHYRERVATLFELELMPMPGAADMLAGLEIPFCIASSGPLAKIRQALAVTQLAPFFGERIFSSYDVGSWKPEPGVLLHAAEVMGFSPAACAVIEDSQTGIAAAQAAGMQVVCYAPVGSPNTPDDVQVIRDLRELLSIFVTK